MKYTNALYPDKINDLVNNDGSLNEAVAEEIVSAAASKIEGTSLIIPEQEGPQPVATIDGIVYYHKQEFDLEEIVTAYDNLPVFLDLLSGVVIPDATLNTRPLFWVVNGGAAQYHWISVKFSSRTPGPSGKTYLVYRTNQEDMPSIKPDYISQAFTVVDTQDEVTDNTKICLPTCSAYYGFLSEDGKTFISYYNLKGESGDPGYVDSIKQGNAVIPLKAAGGTQLYLHTINLRRASDNADLSTFHIISTDSSQIDVRTLPYVTKYGHVWSSNNIYSVVEPYTDVPMGGPSANVVFGYHGFYSMISSSLRGELRYSGELYIDAYNWDKIDLISGELVARTTVSSLEITYTDTVTEF